MSDGQRARLQERARKVLAGGVSSNTRLLNPLLIAERAAGCRLWDADGNEYIDYLLGQGPNFLGYAPPRVVEKVLQAQRDGVIFAATHVREIEAAERVLEALGDWAETMRFGSSSTEMVQAAIRMARASTGRSVVLRFNGHYHGWVDNIYSRDGGPQAAPASPGQAESALRDVLTIEWNDAQAFECAVAAHADDLAAVIMEPIMINSGVIEPAPGYLETVRRICQRAGDRADLRRDDQRLQARSRRRRRTLRRPARTWRSTARRWRPATRARPSPAGATCSPR